MHACKTQIQMSVRRQHRHAIAFLFRNRCLADALVNSPAGRFFDTAQLPFRHREQSQRRLQMSCGRRRRTCGRTLFGLEFHARLRVALCQRQHVSCTCTHGGLLYACIGASPGRSIFLRCFISVRRSKVWSSKRAPAALHVWKLKKAMTRFASNCLISALKVVL
jgi:hypothetical protein